MTPLEAIILRYVQNHPNTRRKTVVDAIGDRDWATEKRVRATLDVLTTRRVLLKSITKPYRYTVPQQSAQQ